MTIKLTLKPSALKRIVWTQPGSKSAPFCSLCQKHIQGSPPTIIDGVNSKVGWRAQLCDRCTQTNLMPKVE